MKKISLLLLIFFLTGCSFANKEYSNIFESVSNELLGNITKYTIYGKYFNLEGNIAYYDNYDEILLVLKNQEEECAFSLKIKEEDNYLTFKTNEYINEGINLEKISFGNYILLLKIINGNESIYYNLCNKTKYSDVDYYTITNNNVNNYIKISFSKYKNNSFAKMTMKKDVENSNVCDIVLDPGHGGSDAGAVNGNYYEKNINLTYAKMIKDVLEELGLKVKLTRTSDNLPSFYGYNSRTGIPYECHAKLMLSVHLNSSTSKKDNGFELYMAYGSNASFPKIMASNIVNYAQTNYSKNPYNRLSDGIYIRTYSNSDIQSVLETSIKEGWPMYESLSTKTTYYYFIRETGGIITNALTDGRNQKYAKNPYYDSNHGIESYLLELGYISNEENLMNILNNKEGYVEGIVNGIKSYITN